MRRGEERRRYEKRGEKEKEEEAEDKGERHEVRRENRLGVCEKIQEGFLENCGIFLYILEPCNFS